MYKFILRLQVLVFELFLFIFFFLKAVTEKGSNARFRPDPHSHLHVLLVLLNEPNNNNKKKKKGQDDKLGGKAFFICLSRFSFNFNPKLCELGENVYDASEVNIVSTKLKGSGQRRTRKMFFRIKGTQGPKKCFFFLNRASCFCL